MEFWGVEVKSGEPVKVQPDEGMVVHLSQANIGEAKKDKTNESVFLYVNVDGKKMVLGTLFSDKLPQQQFDLVFDREFELSHNWKAGSVFFLGYKANNVDDEGFGTDSDDDEDEDIPLVAHNNGRLEAEAKQVKPASVEKANTGKDSAAGKQKVKIVEPNKDSKPDEDDDSEDDDDDSDEDMDGDSDGDMEEDEDESDSELEDDSDEDNEETPEKVQGGKKRPASATKTPTTDKKAKVATPQKTDGKKGGGHVATPHPAKQAGKTPANKAGQLTPKTGGSSTVTCSSCKKIFGSDNALQSHTKAKHSAGK